MNMHGLIIGAPRSGSGKTTLTLALLAAARRRGLNIRAAKSGPDYIDPAFHEAATGWPSVNLDSWAMAPGQLATVADYAAAADLLVIESSMGLFDGVAGAAGRTGAGADLAARFGLPVVLILDVSGHSQSAAAVARGFALHRPGVEIAGVVLNRVASERHCEGIAAAMDAAGIEILGAIRRDETIAVPERHLGLVQALEHPDLRLHLDRLADLAEQSLDVPGIFAVAKPFAAAGGGPDILPPPGQRIALARDAAFSFVYAHMLEGWRRAGSEIVFFSPLADEAPPPDCDACWLPGGYPELHAGRLAAARRFKTGLAAFAATRPVHGECGGYMVLGANLQSSDGDWHEMAGLLSHETSFAKRRMTLGYRQAMMLADSPLGPAGTFIRGHEFHYASTVSPGTDTKLAELCDAAGKQLGQAGGKRGQVSGTFFHAIARHESADRG
ncbi:MAG TPA: cobyrinate a,c-diamide synthase [Acidocella sp.]|jgi:cobyrinic acid a,c-diamide synthase|uniref:cobyrinate a,c-diamide synthase n=1 Tax=Acidocella sp. TaxID=50710 RepID=UPI002BB4724D|nr:cobyrinate a,c-diamide synthase [Acidocella sp.]HVE22783.1 cobyrinate a,c-diamide synthase [Acidocella sp.]